MRLAGCLEMHFVLRSALGAGLDVVIISLQLYCLYVSFILFLVLQNASLAVLLDTEVSSMDSWDSSWDQEALEPPSTHSSRQSLEVNQETWLMLDYCDKGSLLVSKLLLGGMGEAIREEGFQVAVKCTSDVAHDEVTHQKTSDWAKKHFLDRRVASLRPGIC